MGIARSFVTLVIVAAAAATATGTAAAQTADRALSPLEAAVACASPTSTDVPPDPLRIVGVQDSVARNAFDERDVLVVGGGSNNGVQLGQRYYVRRPIIFGTNRAKPVGVLTLGWLRIVAVNEANAIASIERFCDSMSRGDYLEPFVAPSITEDADHRDASGELDFNAFGHVVSGKDNHSASGAGELVLIDRGTEQGMTDGTRFAIYRDTRAAGAPLASVGEGVVLTAGKTMSLTRITRSRDAVITGDYVVPRK